MYILPLKNGTLDDLLKDCKKINEQISEDRIMKWSRELLGAVFYLSEQKIFHNDLKPS